MQIRKRGSRIALIRSVYVPEIKRNKTEQLGTMSAHDRHPSDELKEKLTHEEMRELEQWLTGYKAEIAQSGSLLAITTLPREIRRAVEGMQSEEGKTRLARIGYLDELVDALSLLKSELRKQGISTTKPKKAPKPDNDQLALPE